MTFEGSVGTAGTGWGPAARGSAGGAPAGRGARGQPSFFEARIPRTVCVVPENLVRLKPLRCLRITPPHSRLCGYLKPTPVVVSTKKRSLLGDRRRVGGLGDRRRDGGVKDRRRLGGVKERLAPGERRRGGASPGAVLANSTIIRTSWLAWHFCPCALRDRRGVGRGVPGFEPQHDREGSNPYTRNISMCETSGIIHRSGWDHLPVDTSANDRRNEPIPN